MSTTRIETQRGLTRLQFMAIGVYFLAAYVGLSSFLTQGKMLKRTTTSLVDWDILSAPTIILGNKTTSTSAFSALPSLSSVTTMTSSLLDTLGQSFGMIEENVKDKPVVMIVACTKSQKTWKREPKKSFVIQHFLPSVGFSVTRQELAKYNVQVLLVFDRGDSFWEKETVRSWVRKQFPRLTLNFLSINKGIASQSRIPFNEACQAAYEYGADYIVRVNDDTEFDVEGWISRGVAKLSEYQHKVGVVGPTDRGNKKILTHDMVHRTHMDIFDRYYPEEFDNWWIDDWISGVYGDDRTHMLSDWTVINHSGKTGDMRYKVNEKLKQHLAPALSHGNQRVRQYLAHIKAATVNGTSYTKTTFKRKHDFCVLGTERAGLVEGPMADFVKAAKASNFKSSQKGPCLSAKGMKWHESKS